MYERMRTLASELERALGSNRAEINDIIACDTGTIGHSANR